MEDRKTLRLPVRLLLPCLALTSLAPSQVGPPSAFRPLLFAAEGAKKILEYDAAGQITWEYPAEMSRDAWRLPNGNTLFCYNRNYDSQKHDNPSGVMEVTRGKRVVFEFQTTGQVFSCQRLANGETLIGAASQGKLLIVSPAGRLLREIRVLNKPGHSCMRNARQIANGNFLVAEESAQAVREYNPAGALVREIKLSFRPYSAVRLENGNSLISGQKFSVEIDPKDREVWAIQERDLPEIGVRWLAGLHILPGGNLMLCNAGGAVSFVEISRDKRIVWNSNQSGATFPLGHGVQRLDVSGDSAFAR